MLDLFGFLLACLGVLVLCVAQAVRAAVRVLRWGIGFARREGAGALRRALPAILRVALVSASLAGASLLIAGDVSDLRGVRVIEVDLSVVTGGAQHDYALLVIGMLVLPALWWAVVRRSVLGLAITIAFGVIAGAIALVVDLPNLGTTAPLDRLYASTTARAGSAIYLELVGAFLLVCSGVFQLRLIRPRDSLRTRAAAVACVAFVVAGGVLAGCGAEHRQAQASRRPVPAASNGAPPAATSTHDRTVYVPDVAGKRQAQAKQALIAASLKVTVIKRSSATVPVGDAIGTSPTAFSFLSPGQKVSLLVSTGPVLVRVPSVVGESTTQAERKLAAAGLTVVLTQQPGSARADSVVRQSPAAGATVPRSSSDQIVIDVAPPTLVVPNFTHQTEETAASTASKLGFTLAFTTQVVHRLALDHIVLAQAPAAGIRLLKGFRLTLAVGRYEPEALAGQRRP